MVWLLWLLWLVQLEDLRERRLKNYDKFVFHGQVFSLNSLGTYFLCLFVLKSVKIQLPNFLLIPIINSISSLVLLLSSAVLSFMKTFCRFFIPTAGKVTNVVKSQIECLKE